MKRTDFLYLIGTALRRCFIFFPSFFPPWINPLLSFPFFFFSLLPPVLLRSRSTLIVFKISFKLERKRTLLMKDVQDMLIGHSSCCSSIPIGFWIFNVKPRQPWRSDLFFYPCCNFKVWNSHSPYKAWNQMEAGVKGTRTLTCEKREGRIHWVFLENYHSNPFSRWTDDLRSF